jgi:hypothetical protein
LTWLYCLMCQPEPKDEQFRAMGNERWMPTALNDRKAEHWLGEASLCRKLLEELAERELAHLRPREELLRSVRPVNRIFQAGRGRGMMFGAPS